jgi:hypothetical protein
MKAGTPLTEHQKTAVLLALAGYVSSLALQGGMADGAREGHCEPDHATEAFGELLRTVVDAERFPALFEAVEGGRVHSIGRRSLHGLRLRPRSHARRHRLSHQARAH